MRMKKEKSDITCDFCGECMKIIYIDGYFTCSACGVVSSKKDLDFEDTSVLFSSTTQGKDKKRCQTGFNPLFPNISSSIGTRRINVGSKEQRSYKDYRYLEGICKKIGVGKDRMLETFFLFEEVKGENVKKRKDGRLGTIMGCLSMVLSTHGDGIVSDDDIAKIARIKPTVLYTEKRNLQKLFSLKGEKFSGYVNERFSMIDHVDHQLNLVKEHDFFIKMLVINGSITKIVDRGYGVREIEDIKDKKIGEIRINTHYFLEQIKESMIMQKHVRTTISAVLIYLGLEKSGVPILRKILSKIFDLSENTISKCLKNVCIELNIPLKRDSIKSSPYEFKDLIEEKTKGIKIPKEKVKKIGGRKKTPIIENM
jgi:transcription initiation factor TFIIIB Brf1 subunit/transcription initiation factor TFIIB